MHFENSKKKKKLLFQGKHRLYKHYQLAYKKEIEEANKKRK